MKKEALDLWGIRFSNMQKIEMRPAAADDDLSQTIMAFFCANSCTLQIFSQKIAQKKAQIFYGSYMFGRLGS